MDRVFLAFSVNGAVYTANALRPSKNPVLFLWSFFASWITIEFAWMHLVWQAAGTAYFISRGALRTTTGKLSLALMIASWVGLASMVYRSLSVRHEVRAAFRDWTHPKPGPRGHGWHVEKDITYTQIKGKPLKLDVYRPRNWPDADIRRPAIVQIHGGGWVIGDKREQGLPLLKHLASQGWVGFNVNYRLSPRATFPEHLIDLKQAIAWIREHADDYGIDPDFIAVTGGSAGGHLTAMVALTANDASLQPGFEDADTSVQAAVPFYGVYDFTNRHGYYPKETVKRFFGPVVLKADLDREPEKFSAASPIDHVRADAPPFLVVHGDADTLAPVEGARDFVQELGAVSKMPVVYLELAGAQHAFEIMPSIRANQVVHAAEHFLDTVYHEYLGDAAFATPAVEVAGAGGRVVVR